MFCDYMYRLPKDSSCHQCQFLLSRNPKNVDQLVGVNVSTPPICGLPNSELTVELIWRNEE